MIVLFHLKIHWNFSGYLEYDHPEIAVTMKTKEEIYVILNISKEVLKSFETKGIIHKNESALISKVR